MTIRPKPMSLFTSNGDYQNRGCEAISRGTIAILQRAFGPEIGVVDTLDGISFFGKYRFTLKKEKSCVS